MPVDTITVQTTIEGYEFGLDVANRPVSRLSDGKQYGVVLHNPTTGELIGANGASVSGAGIAIRRATVGDSLMAREHTTNALTNQPTYDSTTGLLTFTQTSHGHFTGMGCRIHSSSGDLFRDLTLTRIDANTFSVNIGAGKSIISTTTNWYISNEYQYNAEGVHTHLRPSRPKLYNCGISGATAAIIRAYSLPQALATDANVIDLRAGPNDATGGDVDATYAHIEAMALAVEASGKLLFLHTIPPIGDTVAQGKFAANLSAKIRLLQARIKNSALIDDYAIGVDPTSATGSAKAGYQNPSDKTHFAPIYSKLVAAREQEVFDAVFGRSVSPCPTSALDAYDATNNPTSGQPFPKPTLITTTGGTVGTGTTGVAASGMTTFATGAGTPVASVVAAANGIGNAQRLVGTPAANGDLMRPTTRASEAAVAALLIPGKRYKAVCHLKVSGLTGQSVLQSYATFVVFTNAEVTGNNRIGDGNWAGTAAQIPQVDFETDIETPEFTCPPGVTSAYIDPQVKFAAAGASPVTTDGSTYAFIPVN
jgi:hypothetical protein